jgi:hypothetical protein
MKSGGALKKEKLLNIEWKDKGMENRQLNIKKLKN